MYNGTKSITDNYGTIYMLRPPILSCAMQFTYAVAETAIKEYLYSKDF